MLNAAVIFTVGLFVTSLCVAFLVITIQELHRLGQEADREEPSLKEY